MSSLFLIGSVLLIGYPPFWAEYNTEGRVLQQVSCSVGRRKHFIPNCWSHKEIYTTAARRRR